MQEIKLKIIDLTKQRIVETLQASVLLTPKQMVIRMEFYYDQYNDTTEVWDEGLYNNVTYHYGKEIFVGVQKFWSRAQDCWLVELMTVHSDNNYQFFFSREAEASEFKITVLRWLGYYDHLTE